MRVIKVNGKICDTDDKTAVGITFQSGDISNPVQLKLSTSNSFTLPKTSRNKRIFEFADNPSSSSNLPYQKMTLDLIDGNIELIKGSKCFLSSAIESFNITAVNGATIIDALKYNQVRSWLIHDFVGYFSSSAPDFFLNDVFYQDMPGLVNNYEIDFTWMRLVPVQIDNPGFLFDNFIPSITLKDLLDFFSLIGIRSDAGNFYYTFSFEGTTSQNSEFEKLIIPLMYIRHYENQSTGDCGFKTYDYDDNRIGIKGYNWYGENSLLDIIKSIAVLFNAVIDINDSEKTFKIITFNKILENTNTINWGGKITTKKPEKKFSLGGWAQRNLINYEYDDTLNIELGICGVDCNNYNIEALKQFKNGLFIHKSKNVTGDDFYLLGSLDKTQVEFTSKGIDKLFFYYLGAQKTNMFYGVRIYKISGYDFSANYSEIRAVLQNPVVYNVELNLKLLDLHSYSLENLYKIDELAGVFYCNKIIGFNTKSKTGTQVELIKVR